MFMDNTNRTAAASARILALIAAGMSPVDALKAICGAETVDAMIDSLYTDLRAKGGR
jgi:hypothetical protein